MLGVSCGETMWATMPTWPKSWGKIMWLGTNRASKWKTTFERNGGWESQEETNLQIPMQNEHVCAKTTAKPDCHFHTKHIFFVRVAKFEHGEMPKSTNNPGAIVRVWPCRCLWSTGAAFQTRQKKTSRLLETSSKLNFPFYSHLFLDGAQALEFWHE